MALLFCYGTLQVPDVVQAVLGRIPAGTPARLPGYARFRVNAAGYPGIVRRPAAETPGTLYADISEEDVAILDRFEGELYSRRSLRVVPEDGRRLDAWAYVIAAGQEQRLSSEAWSLARFLESGLDQFMHSYVEERKREYIR